MPSDEIKSKQLEYFADYFKQVEQARAIKQQQIEQAEHIKLIESFRHKTCGQIYREGEQHLIENYAAAKQDNFVYWHLHHRLEFTLNGDKAHSVSELIRLDMYFNRPYYELIYMTTGCHIALHNSKDANEVERVRRLYNL